ncbi:hypothetical protein DFH06DRAFT_1128167 [Mycena polygramma]|nr:hypothetical protein DFH06DRAFT_1128167 [Mycena polygramma]
MRFPPTVDRDEETKIAAAERAVIDQSRVDYRWDGLVFPKRLPGVRYFESEVFRRRGAQKTTYILKFLGATKFPERQNFQNADFGGRSNGITNFACEATYYASGRRIMARSRLITGVNLSWNHDYVTSNCPDIGQLVEFGLTHRNEDKLREEARERMARYRARIKASEELAEEARARAREASKRYRETHAAQLAHRQRIVRMEAYERKHGHRAWLARYEKLQAQRAAAQEMEEMRRHEEEFRRIDELRRQRELRISKYGQRDHACGFESCGGPQDKWGGACGTRRYGSFGSRGNRPGALRSSPGAMGSGAWRGKVTGDGAALWKLGARVPLLEGERKTRGCLVHEMPAAEPSAVRKRTGFIRLLTKSRTRRCGAPEIRRTRLCAGGQGGERFQLGGGSVLDVAGVARWARAEAAAACGGRRELRHLISWYKVRRNQSFITVGWVGAGRRWASGGLYVGRALEETGTGGEWERGILGGGKKTWDSLQRSDTVTL